MDDREFSVYVLVSFLSLAGLIGIYDANSGRKENDTSITCTEVLFFIVAFVIAGAMLSAIGVPFDVFCVSLILLSTLLSYRVRVALAIVGIIALICVAFFTFSVVITEAVQRWYKIGLYSSRWLPTSTDL